MKNSTNKILTIAVVLLLLTNIALVVFMIKDKNRHSGKPRGNRSEPFEMMVKELNMTEQQQKEYKELKEEHLKNIKPWFDSIRSAKKDYYALIKDSAISDSIVTVYNQRISERQAAADRLTFAHFKRVRNLFTAEQQPRFDEFIQKMMQHGRRDSAAKKGK